MLRKLVYFNTQLIDDIKRAVLSHKKKSLGVPFTDNIGLHGVCT